MWAGQKRLGQLAKWKTAEEVASEKPKSWFYQRAHGGGSQLESAAGATSAADANEDLRRQGVAPPSTEPAGDEGGAEAAPMLPVDLYNERGLDEGGKPVWHKPPQWLAPHGNARARAAAPPPSRLGCLRRAVW